MNYIYLIISKLDNPTIKDVCSIIYYLDRECCSKQDVYFLEKSFKRIKGFSTPVPQEIYKILLNDKTILHHSNGTVSTSYTYDKDYITPSNINNLFKMISKWENDNTSFSTNLNESLDNESIVYMDEIAIDGGASEDIIKLIRWED